MAIYLLCGFMGSGKTTMMQQLSAEAIGIDLDFLILESLQRKGFNSIAEFVEEEDWEEFRYLESDNLSLLLDEYADSDKDVIVSLGGGAVNQMNLTIIEGSSAELVWLDVPFEECWERIKDDEQRPLVLEGREEVEKLYKERLKMYRRAQVRVNPSEVKNLQSLKSLIVAMR